MAMLMLAGALAYKGIPWMEGEADAHCNGALGGLAYTALFGPHMRRRFAAGVRTSTRMQSMRLEMFFVECCEMAAMHACM